MPNDKKNNNQESDYELALRLAGLSADGKTAIEKPALPLAAKPASANAVIVRVNALNKPSSILKKWHDPSASDVTSRQKKAALVKDPIKPKPKTKSKATAKPTDPAEADYFYNGDPKLKSFKNVFADLDNEPLLESRKEVDLTSLDGDFPKKGPSKR